MEHELEFRASRARAIWLVLGSLAFVAVGIWGGSSGSWAGWTAVAFGGLCLVATIVQFIAAGRTVLTLDPDGLAMIQWGLGPHRGNDVLVEGRRVVLGHEVHPEQR
ncbi:MAG: hypothetical protein ACRDG9_07285 [Actinomycetota bacterium]